MRVPVTMVPFRAPHPVRATATAAAAPHRAEAQRPGRGAAAGLSSGESASYRLVLMQTQWRKQQSNPP